MVDISVKKTMIAAPTCMGDGRVMKNRRSFNEVKDGKDGLGTFQ